MKRAIRCVVLFCVFAAVGLAASSCGGGGSSESVVPGRLTITNNCTTGTYTVTVNGTAWGTVAPGASVSNELAPAFYDSLACLSGTTACKADRSGVSSREHLTLLICQ